MDAGMSLPAPDAMDAVLLRQEPSHSSQESTGDTQELGLGRYRRALQRMAGALLSLRQRTASLEVENRHLRHSLARLRAPAPLGHTPPDLLSREELLERLATQDRELAAGMADLRALRDCVQRLQNELIRKNDREKELMLLARWHRQQQVALRRWQVRVAKDRALERALRLQEKVIEAMEQLLRDRPGRSTETPAGKSSSFPSPPRPALCVALSPRGEGHGTLPAVLPGHPNGGTGGGCDTLRAENRWLREEMARSPRGPGVLGGSEKLRLLARLEEAQARGRMLERQLQEVARIWGREKQDLWRRLRERENGLSPAP